MNPVRTEELSALIDGELDPQRAAEVEMMIAANQELRLEFEAMRKLDERWRVAAREKAFTPRVRLPVSARWKGWVGDVAVSAALVGMRIAVRVADTTTIAFALQMIALAMVLAGVAWLERRDARRSVDQAI